ncbi:hypothetical protein [Plantactinospora sp. KBS50]|uniref:hypothetical protein n=1 Tax=Plantactinospora sp. KBS50 TaxID=2024580 RepID=UPI0018DFD4C6|nr:hypothetical protein [Plantactinospora sp. KBS50]
MAAALLAASHPVGLPQSWYWPVTGWIRTSWSAAKALIASVAWYSPESADGASFSKYDSAGAGSSARLMLM